MEDKDKQERRRQIALGAQSDPTGWFDPLYKNARAASDLSLVPWSRGGPHPVLSSWLEKNPGNGRAMITGCGLGDDAHAVSAQGYRVTAFDVSTQAILWCRARFGSNAVQWAVADLLALPEQWAGAFELVVENRTVQALPPRFRAQAAAAVASMVAQGGQLLAICTRRPDHHPPEQGPPWRYSESEMNVFAQHGLEQATLEVIEEPYRSSTTLRATYQHR